MKFGAVLRTLNFRQIYSLVFWFLKHPLFMFATIIATYETFRISQHHFPNIHGKHNKANAFRHALWNILIAKKASFFSADERVLKWTKEITDWHEEFSPNSELAKLMDLHNNKVGRDFYNLLKGKSKDEIVKILQLESKNAIRIERIAEITEVKTMVYLMDDDA